jgi:hypothetical protein
MKSTHLHISRYEGVFANRRSAPEFCNSLRGAEKLRQMSAWIIGSLFMCTLAQQKTSAKERSHTQIIGNPVGVSAFNIGYGLGAQNAV